MVDAEEAEQLGLLNRLTGPEDLLDQTLAMATQICANSPGGIRLSKRALQANMEVTSFAAALELENRGQALLTRCDDMTEALEAFKAKRVPNFPGGEDEHRSTHWNRVSRRPLADVLDELRTAHTLTFDEHVSGIVVMSVNRPHRGNSQTVEMFGEIAWATATLRNAPLRALIITGAGGKAFCTGFDLD